MKSERGQSLVELAVSFVVLMYLLSGAVEFGIAFFQFVQLRDAAQEGALYGAIDPHNPDLVEKRARNASHSPIDLRDGSIVGVSITGHDQAGNQKLISELCEGHADGSTDSITVEITYNHHIFMPFLPQLIGRDTLPLRARVTDTVLQPHCTN